MARTRSGTAGPRKAAARRGDSAFRVPPFGRSLAMLLLLSREAVMQRWRPFLHVRGLTDQQWRVMRALHELGSLEIIDLGQRCCIHPASLSRILPKLAAQGVISRRHNTADQRRIIVSLSPAGRRLVERRLPTARASMRSSCATSDRIASIISTGIWKNCLRGSPEIHQTGRSRPKSHGIQDGIERSDDC